MSHIAKAAFPKGPSNQIYSSDHTSVVKQSTLYNFFSSNYWKCTKGKAIDKTNFAVTNNTTSYSPCGDIVVTDSSGYITHIYGGTSNVIKKSNGAIYNGPVYIGSSDVGSSDVGSGGCLLAVGGYNVNSYELLGNLLKGKSNCSKSCYVDNKKIYNVKPNSWGINNDIQNIDVGDGTCLSEELLEFIVDPSNVQTSCKVPGLNGEMWEANYLNFNYQWKSIVPNGINKDQNLTDPSSQFLGPTFSAGTGDKFDDQGLNQGSSAEAWINVGEASGNKLYKNRYGKSGNYITWPLPANGGPKLTDEYFSRSGPGLYLTGRDSKCFRCPQDLSQPSEANCLRESFIHWDNKAFCTPSFNIRQHQKNFMSAGFHKRVSFAPAKRFTMINQIRK